MCFTDSSKARSAISELCSCIAEVVCVRRLSTKPLSIRLLCVSGVYASVRPTRVTLIITSMSKEGQDTTRDSCFMTSILVAISTWEVISLNLHKKQVITTFIPNSCHYCQSYCRNITAQRRYDTSGTIMVQIITCGSIIYHMA